MSRDNQNPLVQLVLSRIRLFLREPAAVFWVYGFPLLMLIALGVAFRDNPQEKLTVDVIGPGDVTAIRDKLSGDSRFKVVTPSPEEWRKRLQYGKTDLVIEVGPDQSQSPKFWEEPRRAESRRARY